MRSYRYIVNEEKRTVVCIITVYKKYCEGTFTGIAKCSPDDRFDETHGKLLAKRRAILKEQMEELKNIEYEYGFDDVDYYLKKFKYLVNRKGQIVGNIKKLKREISEATR